MSTKSELSIATVKRWLRIRLAAAQRAHLSAEEARKRIGEKLNDLTFDRASLLLRLHVSRDLVAAGAVTVLYGGRDEKLSVKT